MLKKVLAKSTKDIKRVGKAELKVTVIIVFYAFFGMMGLASTVYLNQNIAFQNSVVAYIICESSGFAPDCLDVLDIRTNEVVSALLSTAFCSLLLWPVIIIIFTIEPKLYRVKCKRSSIKTDSSSSNTNSSKTTSSQL